MTETSFQGERDGRDTRVTWTPPPWGFCEGRSFGLLARAEIDEGGPAANLNWRGSVIEHADIEGGLSLNYGYRARYAGGQRRWVKKGSPRSACTVTPRGGDERDRTLELKFSCGGGDFYRITWTCRLAPLVPGR